MNRQADSRSPTVRLTPSRNVPIKSTETQNKPVLTYLLEGLRNQMDEDRKEQDELERTLGKMIRNIKAIRKRQDDWWKHIALALRSKESETEEELGEFLESQTQVFDYNDGFDGFRAISEEGDSVLGQVHGTGSEVPVVHGSRQRDTTALSTTTGSANYVLGLARQGIPDDETDTQTVRAFTETSPLFVSGMPSPITPGNPQQRKTFTHITPPIENEILDLTNVSSPESSSEPESPTLPPILTSITPKAKAAIMQAPATPINKSKRKRVEKPFHATLSSDRPKRRAREAASVRNKALYDFSNHSQGTQDRILREQSESPFKSCGGCGKLTCKRCEERREQLEWSAEQHALRPGS